MFGKQSQSSKKHVQSATQRVAMESLENRQMLSATPIIWACDSQGRLFYTNAQTGAVNVVGKMPTVMFDIAANPSGYLYGVDSSRHLWSINAANASAHEIGSLGVSDNVNSLMFAKNGTLYAAGSNLYTVSTSTGHASYVESLGGFTSAGDLEIDNSGRLLLSTNQGDLVQLNPFNHTVHTIGAFGYSQVYGMAEGANGVMYGMSNATDQIFAINLTTGHGYSPVSFGWSKVQGVDGATTIPTHNLVNPTPVAVGQTLYASDYNGNIFTINTATGATHIVTHTSRVMYDIAFNKSGQLFGIDTSKDIFQINTSTGALTFIGSLGVSDNVNSMTFGADGYLYAAGSYLYKINVSTHTFYNEGYLHGYVSAGDLAFDKYGTLVLTTTSNQLIAINPANAATSVIGSIGKSEVYGLAEGNDGVLYGMSEATDQIFAVNPITGAASDVISFTGVDGVTGTAVYP